jgi:hypothetical protein
MVVATAEVMTTAPVAAKMFRNWPSKRYLLGDAGYVASKRCYFYGLRVHVLVTAGVHMMEMVSAARAEANFHMFKRFRFDSRRAWRSMPT